MSDIGHVRSAVDKAVHQIPQIVVGHNTSWADASRKCVEWSKLLHKKLGEDGIETQVMKAWFDFATPCHTTLRINNNAAGEIIIDPSIGQFITKYGKVFVGTKVTLQNEVKKACKVKIFVISSQIYPKLAEIASASGLIQNAIQTNQYSHTPIGMTRPTIGGWASHQPSHTRLSFDKALERVLNALWFNARPV